LITSVYPWSTKPITLRASSTAFAGLPVERQRTAGRSAVKSAGPRGGPSVRTSANCSGSRAPTMSESSTSAMPYTSS